MILLINIFRPQPTPVATGFTKIPHMANTTEGAKDAEEANKKRRAATIASIRRISSKFGRKVVKVDPGYKEAAVGTVPIKVAVKKTLPLLAPNGDIMGMTANEVAKPKKPAVSEKVFWNREKERLKGNVRKQNPWGSMVRPRAKAQAWRRSRLPRRHFEAKAVKRRTRQIKRSQMHSAFKCSSSTPKPHHQSSWSDAS